MSLKSMTRYLELKSPSWANIKHIETLMNAKSFKLEQFRLDYNLGNTSFVWNSIEDVFDLVGKDMHHYNLSMTFNTNARISLHKITNIHKQHLHFIIIEEFGDETFLDEVCTLLGLEKEKPVVPKLSKSVFIAYRFDEYSQRHVDKLAYFLKLLNFNVSTGRAFSPGSIAEKVKTRMNNQDIVIAVHTPGEDKTWITQETLLGTLDKEMIILKHINADFKPGILQDHEFIEFDEHIEKTFAPLLEGFKELGITF